MATEVQTPHDEASMTSLMRGIINDIGDLIRQEIRFAKTELKTDLRKTRQAVALVAVGSAIAGLGAVLLAFMLVHLLHWLSFPAGTAPESASIPLWGCFGIVSAVLLGIGSAVAWAGCKKFQNFNPLPDQTAQTVKENVEWITNSK
jgi:CHASE3 domain sensor protein